MTNGSLVVFRPKSYMDGDQNFSIFINGIKYGEIGAGEAKEFSLAEGCYDVKIRYAWWAGRNRSVQVLANQRTTVACPHRLRSFGIFLNGFLMMLAPMSYFQVKVIR